MLHSRCLFSQTLFISLGWKQIKNLSSSCLETNIISYIFLSNRIPKLTHYGFVPIGTITSLKNYYFFYLCMYMWIYVHHVSTIALEVRWHWVHGTGGADGCKPPDVWVLKTELRPSIGIFSTLNFWAISSVPQSPVFNTKFQQDQEVFCDWRLCGGTVLPQLGCLLHYALCFPICRCLCSLPTWKEHTSSPHSLSQAS